MFAPHYARLSPPDGSLPLVPTGSGDLARPLSPQQPLQHVLLTIEELEQADDELLNFEMMFINSPIIAETTREEHIRLIIQNRRPFLPPMATSPPTLMPKSFKTPNLYRRQHQYHLKQPYLIHQYLNIEHRLS